MIVMALILAESAGRPEKWKSRTFIADASAGSNFIQNHKRRDFFQ
ncbi:hypothetical protein [Salmonella enterica]|nr:hypothetical protein [Salmonella enterica]